MLKAGLNNISFSLDGTHDKNDFIRGGGVYDKVIRALEMFHNMRLSRMVQVFFTVSRANYDTLLDMIKIVRSYGVRRIFLNAFNLVFCKENKSEKREVFWIPGEELDRLNNILHRSKYLADKLGVNFPSDDCLQNIVRNFSGESMRTVSKCQIPYNNISVDVTGNVKVCWKMRTDFSVLRQDIIEIWESEKYQLLLEKAKETVCPGCLHACDFLGA